MMPLNHLTLPVTAILQIGLAYALGIVFALVVSHSCPLRACSITEFDDTDLLFYFRRPFQPCCDPQPCHLQEIPTSESSKVGALYSYQKGIARLTIL